MHQVVAPNLCNVPPGSFDLGTGSPCPFRYIAKARFDFSRLSPVPHPSSAMRGVR